MTILYKTFKVDLATALKADKPGEGSAVIAMLNVIDSDDDVTLPGAFGEQHVNMLPAHRSDKPRLGKAILKEAGNLAVADFKFNLDPDAKEAREWYAALKFDLKNGDPLQEWSYGFKILDSSEGEFEGRQVRFLKSLKVFEISPVLRGAGVGTGTLAIKDDKKQTFKDEMDKAIASLVDVKAVISRTQSLVDMRTKEGKKVSDDRVSDLKALSDSLVGLLKDCETTFAQIEQHEMAIYNLYSQCQKTLSRCNYL